MAITRLNSLAIPAGTVEPADISYPLTNFSSTGIDDNATSTKLTVSNSGIDVTGTVTANDLTLSDSTPAINLYDTDGDGRLNIVQGAGISYLQTFGDGGFGTFILSSYSGATPKEIIRADNTNIQFKTDATLRGRFLLNGDYVLYNDAGTSTDFYWDASTSRLGIGTTSPATTLHLETSGNTGIQLRSGTASYGNINFNDGATAKGQILYDHNGDYMRLYVNGSERMRIDSSGNLLVGHTGSIYNNINTTSTIGSSYSTNGEIFACSSQSSGVMFLNRKSSDGAIATFRKDGTTVGSIVSLGGTSLRFNSQGATGILQNGGSDKYTWSDSAFASANDNYRDLGSASYRWKDLYLSGGAYLGGTGSANKLDDYEEGTFTVTPTFGTSGSATLSRDLLSYTKIGQVVYITGQIQFNVLSSPTGSLTINAPFAVKSPVGSDRETNSFFYGTFQSLNAAPPTGTDGDQLWFTISASQISLLFYNGYTNTATNIDATYLKTGSRITITGWYLAT